MNTEEAVEEILLGNPWQPCPQCEDGSQTNWFGERGKYLRCPVCAGGGYIPRKNYAEACRMLARDMPPRPEYRGTKRVLYGSNEARPVLNMLSKLNELGRKKWASKKR